METNKISLRTWLMVYLFFTQIYNGTINMCRVAYGQAAHMSTYGRVRGRVSDRLRSFAEVLLDLPTEKTTRVRLQDWCLPRLNPMLKWYLRLCTSIMVYVVLISVLPLEDLANWLFDTTNLPKHCLVPGHLILFGPLPNMMACACCIIHLYWRVARRKNQYHLNMVAFLIQDEELVEREHRKIAPQLEVLSDKRGLDQYQLYLSNLLYHQCPSTGVYILRPNRSGEARARLARFIRRISITATLVFLLSTLIIGTVVILGIFRDITYVARYPGCSPHLEQQLAMVNVSKNTVTLAWSQNKHKLMSNLVDFLVNWVLWFESGAAIAYVLSLTYLFNYDFLIYWSFIGKQLIQLESQLKMDWLLASQRVRQGKVRNFDSTNIDLEQNICHIQAHLIDFFLQLGAVDRLVSDIVTHSLVFWWSIFTFCTLYFLRQGPNSVALEMRLIQWVAVAGLFVENLFLLALRRTINGSYVTMCSVIAYDQSRHRCRFTTILDFWHGATWTLFQHYTFTPTTTLTLVGWSISLIVAGENFARRVGA